MAASKSFPRPSLDHTLPKKFLSARDLTLKLASTDSLTPARLHTTSLTMGQPSLKLARPRPVAMTPHLFLKFRDGKGTLFFFLSTPSGSAKCTHPLQPPPLSIRSRSPRSWLDDLNLEYLLFSSSASSFRLLPPPYCRHFLVLVQCRSLLFQRLPLAGLLRFFSFVLEAALHNPSFISASPFLCY